MADEADSKSVGGNTVWVQVPLPAVSAESNRFCAFFLYFYNHIAFPAFSNFFPIISYGLIVTIHLCLANTDVTEHQATGKGGRKYVFQIH